MVAHAPCSSLRAVLQGVLLSAVAALGACADRSGETRDELELKHASLVPGFVNELVLPGINQPTSMAFLPDGRLLITEKGGRIAISDPRQPLPVSAATYMTLPNVNGSLERGLLDIALDPDFSSNGLVYLLYTARTPKLARISRFTHRENGGGLGSTGDVESEQIIWEDTDGYPQCCHYGGALAFGPDGKLYATLGDKFDDAMAQDLTKAGGKLLRLNRDGTIPNGSDGTPANPFADGPGGNHDPVWAFGLRNPFRATWDFATNRLLIGEVGGNHLTRSWEDVHVASSSASAAGRNFGWPKCEGTAPHTQYASCDDADNTPHDDPIFGYRHNGSGAAIIAGLVYRGDQFPADPFQGAFFYGDYAREFIRYLRFDYAADPSGRTVLGDFEFEPNAGPVVCLRAGSDGSLYYLTLSGSGGSDAGPGDLRRISFAGANLPPRITSLDARPGSGSAPLLVSFDAVVSDPEAAAMSYEWVYGDGESASGAVPTGGALPSATHTYPARGSYLAHLRVSDGARTTVSDAIPIEVGSAPTAVITAPLATLRFRGQDAIAFTGTAIDDDETDPAAVVYTWQVRFGHEAHYHPVVDPVALGPDGGAFSVGEAAHDFEGNTGFRIDLTVTDSDGLSDTDSVEIVPERVALTLDTVPSGIPVVLDGTVRETPLPLQAVPEFLHDVTALGSRCVGGVQYAFQSWSDGGAFTHSFAVPASPTTLRAVYAANGSCSQLPVTEGLVFRLKGDLGVSTSGSTVTQWSDQSSSGNHLTVTAGAPQLLSGALNGHSVVRFDGVDDGLGRANPLHLPMGSAARSTLMVVRYGSEGWGGFAWGNPTCNRAFGLAVSSESNDLGRLALQGWCSDFKSSSVGTGAGFLRQAALYGAGGYRLFRDGAAILTGTHLFDTGNARLRLGVSLSDGRPVNMDVAEVLAYDRLLSDAELQQIDAYFQAEYFGGGTGAPNVPPASSDDFATVARGASTSIAVLANDSDGDGTLNPASVTVQAPGPSHGTVTVDATTGAIVYRHGGGAATSDSFSYVVGDDDGASSNVATVSIVITDSGGSLDLPVTGGLVFRVHGDEGLATSGTSVTQWSDLSGSANHLTVTSGAPQVLLNAVNGHAAVRFDGVDDGLGRASPTALPSGASERTVFLVARYRSDGWGGFAWGNPTCGRAFGLVVSDESNNLGKLALQTWCTDFKSAVAGTGSGWLRQTAVLAGGSYALYRNGSEIASGAHAFQTGDARMRLGVGLNDGRKVDMDVAEVIVFARALSTSERSQVESFLAAKYPSDPGPSNAPPAANSDVASVPPGGSVVLHVLANDTDADGALVPSTVAIQPPGPTAGSASVDATTGAITYQHAGGAATTDTFRYVVRDNQGASSNTATVNITVEGGGGPTLPSTLPVPSGVVFHLRAELGVSVGPEGVVQWADQSVRGNHLIPVSGAPQLVPSGPNGRPYVHFDGVDDGLGRASPIGLPTASADRSVFMVARYASEGWGGFTWGNPSCNRAFGLAVSEERNDLGLLSLQGWCTDFRSATRGSGAGWIRQSVVYEGSSYRLFVGGAEVLTGTHAFATGNARVRLGVALNDSRRLDMDVAEVIVYDRALSEAERQVIESYLAAQYFSP